jgi:hypothetical protein
MISTKKGKKILLVVVVVLLPRVPKKWNMQNVKPITNTTIITSLFPLKK